jgi:hypothetical protein
MKAFPFAIWPNTLMKAGSPESNAFHARERLDPARSYSVVSATPVVDPQRSSRPMEYITPPLDYGDERRSDFHDTYNYTFTDPQQSIYTSKDIEVPRGYQGYLPPGYAHRNADIRGRQHLMASANHDAAFHELSDLHRAVGGEMSVEHLTLLQKAEKRFLLAQGLLEHARTAHARALAEPAMAMQDTYHGTQGQTAQEQLKKLLRGGLTFPATSFANFDEGRHFPLPQRPEPPEITVARKMALRGSTPFLAAYLNFAGKEGPSGFLPEGDTFNPDYRYGIPQTPEAIAAEYKTLAEMRTADASRGLPGERPGLTSEIKRGGVTARQWQAMSGHPSHVADGTSSWADFSGDARNARAFRPHNSEWALQGRDPSSIGRAVTLQDILGAVYRGR